MTAERDPMNQRYDVAAYIWPAYTGDEPRTRMFWPEGIGEWQSVKNAVKKFPEHDWPRRPVWGYVNEADPYVMQMEIDAAADHGVNVFIYDWYWYDRRPFLETCLDNGYLKARNNDRVKFYLMWANHHVPNIWDIRTSDDSENIIWLATVDRAEFERLARRIIDRYFHHRSYYTIDGKPVFMVYDVQNLVEGLGGLKATRSAIDWFRKECVRSGLPGLHLQLTLWGERTINLSGVDEGKTATTFETTTALGFDSMTHYQFVHFTDVDRDYARIVTDVIAEWERIDREYSIPYFPHVSLGWDNNPRFREFRPKVVKNATPDEVKKAFEAAREFADRHPDRAPLVTINSWNEWTETSYLEPDDLYGYGYLEAVRDVFAGARRRSPASSS